MGRLRAHAPPRRRLPGALQPKGRFPFESVVAAAEVYRPWKPKPFKAAGPWHGKGGPGPREAAVDPRGSHPFTWSGQPAAQPAAGCVRDGAQRGKLLLPDAGVVYTFCLLSGFQGVRKPVCSLLFFFPVWASFRSHFLE